MSLATELPQRELGARWDTRSTNFTGLHSQKSDCSRHFFRGSLLNRAPSYCTQVRFSHIVSYASGPKLAVFLISLLFVPRCFCFMRSRAAFRCLARLSTAAPSAAQRWLSLPSSKVRGLINTVFVVLFVLVSLSLARCVWISVRTRVHHGSAGVAAFTASGVWQRATSRVDNCHHRGWAGAAD